MCAMSWQTDREEFRLCPCRSGTYRVEWRSDDWGRSEAIWSMQCPVCQQQYSLDFRAGWDSGMRVSHNCWVPRSLSDELASLAGETRRQTDELEKIARERYVEKWHRYFEGMSKRRIWCQLTDGGIECDSPSTFYAHSKHPSGMKGVLDGYFRLKHLPRVLQVLKVTDDELNERMKQISDANATHAIKSDAMFREAKG